MCILAYDIMIILCSTPPIFRSTVRRGDHSKHILVVGNLCVQNSLLCFADVLRKTMESVFEFHLAYVVCWREGYGKSCRHSLNIGIGLDCPARTELAPVFTENQVEFAFVFEDMIYQLPCDFFSI